MDQSVSMQWSGECQEMYRQAIGQRTMRGSVRPSRGHYQQQQKKQRIASDAAQRAVFTESRAEGFQTRITATICKTGKLKIDGERRRRGSGSSIGFHAVIFVECQSMVGRGHATDKRRTNHETRKCGRWSVVSGYRRR